MVAVQRGPQAPNHVNEAPQPLRKGIFRFVEGQRPPSSLAASAAVGWGSVPGPHAALSRGGGLWGAGRRGSVRSGEASWHGRGLRCGGGTRKDPERGDSSPLAALPARREGRPPEPKYPQPHGESVEGYDVVKAVPTGPRFGKVEVPAPPEGPRARRCEFTKPSSIVVSAADIAASMPAAPCPFIGAHLEPNPAGSGRERREA